MVLAHRQVLRVQRDLEFGIRNCFCVLSREAMLYMEPRIVNVFMPALSRRTAVKSHDATPSDWGFQKCGGARDDARRPGSENAQLIAL
jgi:hypothetical protein